MAVGTTGVIFGVIVAAWLAYLVPMYLRRDNDKRSDLFDPATGFSDDVRIVRDSSSQGGAGCSVQVSTPHTRRAMVESVRRAEQRAAARRRKTTVALLVLIAAVVALASFGRTPWWPVAIPGALLVGFLAIARVTVQMMHREFDRKLAAIDDWGVEETVPVQEMKTDKPKAEGLVESVELGMPVGKPGSLWDPLPITRPTYVSAPPVRGRTVRTIDLSAPDPVPGDNRPVVADAPEMAFVETFVPDQRLRVVGE